MGWRADTAIVMPESETSQRRVIRVMLMGGQRVITAGLGLLLEREAEITVVNECVIPGPADKRGDGTLVPLSATDSSLKGIDVIIIDIDGGAEGLLTVLSTSVPRGTRIMILGSAFDQNTLALAFRHGVTGAVLKLGSTNRPPRSS